jgi:hypothetical protein
MIEHLTAVGDQSREHVKAAGGALGIGDGRDVVGQFLDVLDELDHVDAAALQHRAVGQRQHIATQLLKLFLDRLGAAGQEAGAHPVRLVAEAKIDAGRLELALVDVDGGAQDAAVEQVADLLAGQNPGGTVETQRLLPPPAGEIGVRLGGFRRIELLGPLGHGASIGMLL